MDRLDEVQELETVALTLPEKAQQLAIYNAATYAEANQLRRDITDVIKQIDEHHDPIIDAQKKALDIARAAKKRLREPLEQGKAFVSLRMSEWHEEQERKRIAAERELTEKALRLEDERNLADAIQAEEQGNSAAATAILDRPALVPVVSLPSLSPPAIKGTSFSTLYSAKVIDTPTLARFCLENPRYENLIMFDQPGLNRLARQFKDSFNIPGCELVITKTVVQR